MTGRAAGGDAPHGDASDWIRRWGAHVARGGRVLDVACGSGRHARWFASLGCRVLAVDRDAGALAAVREGLSADVAARLDTVQADLELGGWPFDSDAPDGRFDAVVVTNYLWRPLLRAIVASVAPGGWLLYETYTAPQAAIGRPSRPEFLLQPGELWRAVDGLLPVAYEDGVLPRPRRHVQRIAAVRAPSAAPMLV